MNDINRNQSERPLDGGRRSIKLCMAKALITHIHPTHFITLSLVQGRQIVGENHSSIWLRGDDTIYSTVHERFMRSLSKRVASRTSWKRHRPILRSACVIEGGSNGERNHLHILVAKPDPMDDEAFQIMVHRTANGNPWIMSSDYAVDVQKLASGNDGFGAALYSVKRGTDRLSLS